LQLVHEIAENTLETIGIGKDILRSSLATKKKDRKMGVLKIKNLLHNKRNGL
jgi:hypothetical protein